MRGPFRWLLGCALVVSGSARAAPEVCEAGGPLAQVDDDGDGSVNTEGEVYFRDAEQLGDNAVMRYLDADQDGFGEVGLIVAGVIVTPADPYYVCDPTAEPNPALFVSSPSDCDDYDAQVNPAMAERCNGRDDNCNGLSDEPTLGAEPPLGSIPYGIDEDRDGTGRPEPWLAVCPSYGSDPENKPAACNPGVEPVAAVNVLFAGSCWSPLTIDCDDRDPTVYPNNQPDLVDGVDGNCDGLLGLAELDCDDDGGFPAPFGANPREHLGSCDAQDPPSLRCFGATVPLVCHEDDGWTVPIAWVQAIGRATGARRTVDATSSCDEVDCDDLCPNRCGGRGEACDGVDNDCSSLGSAPVDGDADGVPDALDPDTVEMGTVDAGEADVADGGWLYECVAGGEAVEAVSDCEPLVTVPRPAESSEDDDEACGCATGAAPGALLPLLGVIGLLRRRRGA